MDTSLANNIYLTFPELVTYGQNTPLSPAQIDAIMTEIGAQIRLQIRNPLIALSNTEEAKTPYVTLEEFGSEIDEIIRKGLAPTMMLGWAKRLGAIRHSNCHESSELQAFLSEFITQDADR